ncbi:MULTISPECIES: pyridoxal phosphate-dependent aminotransferase [unclassified Streptomyces]|uniref:pyridoxal phosphate-dependent aminotransferase n=1 Tax=unclassified Streptomyces TaxID=2593676 RepID=UPI000A8BDE4C|nr:MULTISPECIES: pyridoxal phosphate-dependent aminotransferase [unclassified Streptomyces]
MVERNLTQEEVDALPFELNLSDGHAFRPWTRAESEIIGDSARFFRESDRRGGQEAEAEYIRRYLALGAQSYIPDHFTGLMSYSASMAVEIVANVLRLRGLSAALIEPCFDNIADILRRHRVPLQPIPETALTAGPAALERLLGTLTADVIFLVSPNNPTGTVVGEEAFTRIVDHCRTENKLLVLDGCFRVYLSLDEVYDHYGILAASGIDCVVIEDTGKVWPAAELKAPFLCVSPGLVREVKAMHSDFLLHLSPFTVRLITEFLGLAEADGGRHLRELVARNRTLFQSTVPGSFLRTDDTGKLGLAWLKVEMDGLDGEDVRKLLARHGVHVLSGERFYWRSPHLGRKHLRMALLRDPDVVQRAAEVIADLGAEVAGSRSRS